MTTPTIEVADTGTTLRFSYDDLTRYHGPGNPGGVAHAFKVLERTLPLLSPTGPPERRQVEVETAFPGPGARDAFELVTRAVTGDRYVIDRRLELPARGRTLERYVFRLRYRDGEVTVALRDGYVTDEFIALARKEGRTDTDEGRLAVLKQEMADRLLAKEAAEVYDVC